MKYLGGNQHSKKIVNISPLVSSKHIEQNAFQAMTQNIMPRRVAVLPAPDRPTGANVRMIHSRSPPTATSAPIASAPTSFANVSPAESLLPLAV